MIKFRIFLNYTKEEEFLNEMSKKGYEFKDYIIGMYTFKKVKPENAIYKIDYRSFVNKQDYTDYCTMFEDSGWKKAAGSHISGIQYFKKISHDSSDDIFSDNVSRAARYKKASELWGILAFCYLAIFLSFLSTNGGTSNLILGLKELYNTRGLVGSMEFILQTPFALGMGLICFIFPICILIYLYFAFKLSKLYKETAEE